MGVGVQRLDEAYKVFGRELLSFATTLVGPGDAQDVVSNALLRLISSEVWENAASQRAVLRRAVYFEGLSWVRSDQRRLVRETRWSFLEPRGDRSIGAAFSDPEVASAMEVLSIQQRAVIYLTYWLDQSVSEVSATLGISDGATRKQLSRARSKLRKAMST